MGYQNILLTCFLKNINYQAYSGTGGRLLFQSQEIDLVLLDIMLPGKGGEECLSLYGERSSVPVIMLTALVIAWLSMLLDGANGYIIKPFWSWRSLRVSVQLREHRKGNGATDNIYQVKTSISPDSFEVSCKGKVIRLGKKGLNLRHTPTKSNFY